MRQAVAATVQPAAVRGQTRYWELADAGHWVSARATYVCNCDTMCPADWRP